MCLIFLSFHQNPKYKLVIAANRDEFYARKTEAAHWWKDHPGILGGRDLEAGGTWMGITESGKLGLVTNYRDLKNIKSGAPSRGHLVSDFLENKRSPEEYAREVEKKGASYNGFNLLTGTVNELWYVSNYRKGHEQLKPGFYGLSNHLLDTPWPKLVLGKEKIKPAMEAKIISPEQMLDLLKNETRAKDEQLPDTGVGLERERELSSMFIKTNGYGTRCSTVILVDAQDHVLFSERVYDLTTFQHTTHTFEFDIR